MTRKNTVGTVVGIGAVLAALVVALLPVTVVGRDIVPDDLAPLVPESLMDTEIECGAVVTPRSSEEGSSIPIVGDRATAACRQRLYRQAGVAAATVVAGIVCAIVIGRRRSTSAPRPYHSPTTQP